MRHPEDMDTRGLSFFVQWVCIFRRVFSDAELCYVHSFFRDRNILCLFTRIENHTAELHQIFIRVACGRGLVLL